MKEDLKQNRSRLEKELLEELSKTKAEISSFIEIWNERENKKLLRIYWFILRFMKSVIKLCKNPFKRIFTLYHKKLLKDSKQFNDIYYLYQNKDLIYENIDLKEHFLKHGWREGKSPNANFNMYSYLKQNPSLLDRDQNPFILKLKNERNCYKALKKSRLFNSGYYLTMNNDIAESNVDPIQHYIKRGYKEGRNPSEYFDTQFYLNTYKDVDKAGINPLWHYIKNGQYEGRIPYKAYTRDSGRMDEVAFQVKRMFYLKKNLDKDIIDIMKFIQKNGLVQLLKKIYELLNSENSLLKNIYNYKAPKYSEDIRLQIKNFKYKPKISVIMPVYNVEPKWIKLAIKSIQNQWYDNWELCIVDDSSTNKNTLQYLKSLNNPKIKVHFLKENLNISGASNKALEMSTGEYILLMDNDDEITDDALYEVVKEINNSGADFIYSDEDKIDVNGEFCEPHFKPDYSPDMLMSQNYISHLGVIKKKLVEEVEGFSVGLEGAQDHDLYLKVVEKAKNIKHIPKVLYHWRKIPGSTASEFSDKSYAQEAGRLSVENAVKRRGYKAEVVNGKNPGTFRVKYELDKKPLVSIIVPFKDKPELLKMCIQSIVENTTYQNYEIIGVSNNSENSKTFNEMERLSSYDSRVRFIEYNIPFNYSKLNNYAVNEFAKGEQIILLNNDIEILTEDWIEGLLGFSQRDDIGAVGGKLYYPNETLQHAGIIIGIGGVAGHSHKYFHREDNGYFSRPHIIQNLSGVTAACLMIKKELYSKVNGLDENNLKVAFNDVDFCLRIQELGYLNIYTPYVEAYHHESISRGSEDNPEKVKRFQSEVKHMQNRHKLILSKGDPFYNPNLSLKHEDYSLKY